MLETLRDIAVASMILSQFAIGVTSAMSGHFRDAINMRKAGFFNLAEAVFADVQDVDIGGRTV